ncbi:MAG TPA: hypothetical protein VGS41_07030, partial [Chthonomonadales bacterium]|nr:hypothetical protein [Chthonomonadales bacterium]
MKLSSAAIRSRVTLSWCAAAAASALLAPPAGAQSVTISEAGAGMSATVNATGAYSVACAAPAASFGGNTGYPLYGLQAQSGTDALGAYKQIVFHYTAGAQHSNYIRLYSTRPIALFKNGYVNSSANTYAFPSFTAYPAYPYSQSFSGAFCHYAFNSSGDTGPLLFFDGSANAFVVSAASHALVSQTLTSSGAIQPVIDSGIGNLPAGFSQVTILAIAHGIHRAFEVWGRALTDMHGKRRQANNAGVILSTLGYWTDNGATYYYNTAPGMTYEQTLLAVKSDFTNAGIPLGYMQLDSWWYPKGPSADWTDKKGGIYTYTADSALFPDGLTAFQQQLGLPMVTHARWIDPSSPYHQQYAMSGAVAIDPAYWSAAAGYLQSSGVQTYEQDWLATKAVTAFNLHDPFSFLNNMAAGMNAKGLSMQYCMPL